MGKRSKKGKGAGEKRKVKKGANGKDKLKKGDVIAGKNAVKNEASGAARGLVNLGNSCFFNAVVQNLYAVGSFREAYGGEATALEGPVGGALQECLQGMAPRDDAKGAFNPGKLFDEIGVLNSRFRGKNQQDAHELFRCLLDGLSEEESKSSSEDQASPSEARPSTLENLFRGNLRSTLRCEECGHQSSVNEPFLDLSLPLISQRHPYSASPTRRSPSESPVEKKKKTAVPVDNGRAKKQKKRERSGKAKGRRGKTEDEDSEYLAVPDSLVAQGARDTDEHQQGTDEGGEVVRLFDTFDLSDDCSEMRSELPPELPPKLDLSEDAEPKAAEEDKKVDEGGDELLYSLFDDVDELSAPSSNGDSDVPCAESTPRAQGVGRGASRGEDRDFAPLLDSIGAFLNAEMLDGDNRPTCDECTRRAREAAKVQAELAPETESRARELERALENTSECSDSTVGAKSTQEGGSSSDAEEGRRDDAAVSGGSRRPSRVPPPVRRRASKKYSLTTLPRILVLQLNRFQQNSLSGVLKKLTGGCEFPLALDLLDYVDGKDAAPSYRLRGVVCHSGTLRSGHYTAYVNPAKEDSESWFHCSDTHVQAASVSEVLRCEPYLLFYEKLIRA